MASHKSKLVKPLKTTTRLPLNINIQKMVDKNESSGKCHPLNNYNKRVFLSVLEETGIGDNTSADFYKKFPKIDPKKLADFINSEAKTFQNHVGDQIHHETFQSLEIWATKFKEHEFKQNCGNELPLALKAVAFAEKHAPSEDTQDINVARLYETLSHATMGRPLPSLTAKERGFLMQLFDELIETVNFSDAAQKDLQSTIESVEDPQAVVVENSFDGNPKREFVTGMNPLRLPFEEMMQEP